MRFHYSKVKSAALRKNPRRAIGFEEATEVFFTPHYVDQRADWPGQYRAIGWAKGKLYTVIFEVREDRVGEYYHLVTLWKSTQEERWLYEQSS